MVLLGHNSAMQSDGKSNSQAQSRPQARSSLTDRDTHSFSDFKQRWMSERSTAQNRLDRSSGLGPSRLQKNDGMQWLNRSRRDSTGVESALSKLRDLRQMREPAVGSHTGSRSGISTSSRSNLSLTERLSQSKCGTDQPMFQRHRTTASQLREIKQIARDGSIITKMSQTAAFRKDRSSVMRSRAGSGSSVLSESYLETRQNAKAEINEQMNARNEKENEQSDADGQMTSISSKLRKQRYTFGNRSFDKQTSIEQKLSQAREIIGPKVSKADRETLSAETTSEASVLLQRLQTGAKRPSGHDSFSSEPHGHRVPKTDSVDEEKRGATAPCTNEPPTEKGIPNNIFNENDKVDKIEKAETAIKQQSEMISTKSAELQEHSFERSRLVASRIFEKLESKKHTEITTKLGLQRKMESETRTSCKLDVVSSDLEEKSERKLGSKDHSTVQRCELKKDAFEMKITKSKPINISGLESQLRNKDDDEEGKGTTAEGPEGSEELATQSVDVRKMTKIVEMSLNDCGAKPTHLEIPLKRSPTVPPKPSPTVSPKLGPKSSIVLGSGDKIRVAVELPDDERNDQENETEERCESSIEIPEKQSVASLRNSLFGGSSSSIEKMLSRGMGGTLAASPVVFRKKQVTERRQVVSSVEVTKNGMASVSMTQTFRMERKSESDATRKADDVEELLPTLYTRFDKPKKPGTAPRTRKSGPEPITLSVKLSDDGDNESD